MEEELGMNLFLGDDFDYDGDESNVDPNGHIVDNDLGDDDSEENNDESSTQNNINDEEDTNEDEDPERVVGGNTEDEDTDDDDDDVGNSSPPLYKSFASLLHKEGVLASVDSSKLEKVETIQDLANLITEEVKAKELIDLTEEQREAVEAFRSGFDVETFQRQKQTENQLNSITEDTLVENEDLRKQLIYQDFINQGFNESKALKLTERSFATDGDIEDAKEALENIRAGVKERFEEEKRYNLEQARLAKEQEEKRIKELENSILKTEEPFAGVKLNETARKEIVKNMMVPVGKNPVTGVEENALMKSQREDPEFSRKLYTVFTLTKGFTDFSQFGKVEGRKIQNDFDKILKNNQHVITGGDASFLDDGNSKDYEIGDNLVL